MMHYNLARNGYDIPNLAAVVIVLVERTLSIKTRDIVRGFYGQAEIVVLVRQNVVVVDRSVVGDALDVIDWLLVAPTNRPCSTATRCYKDCFA